MLIMRLLFAAVLRLHNAHRIRRQVERPSNFLIAGKTLNGSCYQSSNTDPEAGHLQWRRFAIRLQIICFQCFRVFVVELESMCNLFECNETTIEFEIYDELEYILWLPRAPEICPGHQCCISGMSGRHHSFRYSRHNCISHI